MSTTTETENDGHPSLPVYHGDKALEAIERASRIGGHARYAVETPNADIFTEGVKAGFWSVPSIARASAPRSERL